MKNSIIMIRKWMIIGIAAIFLAACNDEDENVADKADLVGIWTAQSVDVEITINGEDFIVYLAEALGISESQAQSFADQMIDEIESDFDGTITFKEDNTYDTNFGDESDSGTWSLSGDGKNLILDEGTDDEVNAEIVEITSSTLRLMFSETEEIEDMDGDDINEEMLMEINMTLTK